MCLFLRSRLVAIGTILAILLRFLPLKVDSFKTARLCGLQKNPIILNMDIYFPGK